MDLINGLKIYSELPYIEEKLFINRGTFDANDDKEKRLIYKDINYFSKYEEGASLPKVDWRKPTDKELKLLLTDNPHTSFDKIISIGAIPIEMKELFLSLNLNEANDKRENKCGQNKN